MRYFLYTFLGMIWFGLIILWPEKTNMTSSPLSEQEASGERLYKASLTEAYFGLLNADFYETSHGKKHWNIKSKFAELHRKENYAFMKEVNSRFFSANSGNVVSTKSDYGRSWMDTDLVKLEGNVRVRSRRGYLFLMDKLDYIGKKHEFRSQDLVRMKGPNPKKPTMLLNGIGLTADINTEHFLLKRRVTGKRRLKNAEWLDVTSQSGEFFTEQHRAIFLGDVHSKMPKIDIISDRLEISTSEGKELLSAAGNVVLENRNRTGKAENAIIEVGGDQIILVGNAQIDSKDNHIRGRRIVLSTTDDRLEVEQAEGRAIQ